MLLLTFKLVWLRGITFILLPYSLIDLLNYFVSKFIILLNCVNGMFSYKGMRTVEKSNKDLVIDLDILHLDIYFYKVFIFRAIREPCILDWRKLSNVMLCRLFDTVFFFFFFFKHL
jgi:hypothetical protein